MHINIRRYSERALNRVESCPSCKKRGVRLSFYQEWYGWDSTFLCCGRQVVDGYAVELPKGRAAPLQREKNKASARSHWRSMKDKPTNFMGQKFNQLEQNQYFKRSLVEWHELSKELPPYDKDGGRDHYSLLVQFPLGTVHEAVYYGDNRFYLDGKRLENVVAWALLPRPYLALVQDPSVTMLNQLKY